MNEKSSAEKEVSLTMVRTLAARPEEVFAAWTDAKRAGQWFAPGDMQATAEIDARVGGRYRIEMREPGGKTHVASGTYKALEPGKRIVKTWQWEGTPLVSEVRVDLRELSPGTTELTLTHYRFPNAEVRGNHEKGWIGCLDNLERYLS
jgi:uncharacterized protein YndB with AHSA1/START domain